MRGLFAFSLGLAPLRRLEQPRKSCLAAEQKGGEVGATVAQAFCFQLGPCAAQDLAFSLDPAPAVQFG